LVVPFQGINGLTKFCKFLSAKEGTGKPNVVDVPETLVLHLALHPPLVQPRVVDLYAAPWPTSRHAVKIIKDDRRRGPFTALPCDVLAKIWISLERTVCFM
jgi:hypothetical protein